MFLHHPLVVDGGNRVTLSGENLRWQLTQVLNELVRQRSQRGPLVLALDDLQWADLGSISLLFHLGRHLAGNRILIVGASLAGMHAAHRLYDRMGFVRTPDRDWSPRPDVDLRTYRIDLGGAR